MSLITIPVSLPHASYKIYIGKGLLTRSGELAAKALTPAACAVITDSHVAQHYLEPTLASLKNAGFKPVSFVVPAGEKSKNLKQAGDLCEQMIAARLDRTSSLFALGGGVIGDLAGFVAAIFQRGIPFVQLPTTIVAQVDSSIGGKVGVNAVAGKNLIGAFYQPHLVITDCDVLDTLPDREYWEGFAEIVKHGIIRDAAMLDTLTPLQRPKDPTDLIARNVAIKTSLVVADEKEKKGLRALLNFGHTIGHGIENAAGYGSLLHGEAISLGIIAALWLSVRHAGLPSAELHRITKLLHTLSLPIVLPDSIHSEAIMTAIEKDKKFEEGAMRFVLTKKLGSAYLSSQVNLQDVCAAIEFLRTADLYSASHIK